MMNCGYRTIASEEKIDRLLLIMRGPSTEYEWDKSPRVLQLLTPSRGFNS